MGEEVHETILCGYYRREASSLVYSKMACAWRLWIHNSHCTSWQDCTWWLEMGIDMAEVFQTATPPTLLGKEAQVFIVIYL